MQMPPIKVKVPVTIALLVRAGRITAWATLEDEVEATVRFELEPGEQPASPARGSSVGEDIVQAGGPEVDGRRPPYTYESEHDLEAK